MFWKYKNTNRGTEGKVRTTSRFVCLLPFSLNRLGSLSRLIIFPESKYAFFIFSNEDCVEQILRIHQRVLITLQGRTLCIECAVNRPYSLNSRSSGNALELGQTLDLATCRAILKELIGTVPSFRVQTSYCASSGLVAGRLPTDIFHTTRTFLEPTPSLKSDSGPSRMRAWRFVCWMDEWGPVARRCMWDCRAPPVVHPIQVCSDGLITLQQLGYPVLPRPSQTRALRTAPTQLPSPHLPPPLSGLPPKHSFD